MDISWQEFEYFHQNLLLKASLEQFVGLIKDDQFEVVSLHETALNHVVNTYRGSNYDVYTCLQDADVFLQQSTSYAGANLDIHELSN